MLAKLWNLSNKSFPHYSSLIQFHISELIPTASFFNSPGRRVNHHSWNIRKVTFIMDKSWHVSNRRAKLTKKYRFFVQLYRRERLSTLFDSSAQHDDEKSSDAGSGLTGFPVMAHDSDIDSWQLRQADLPSQTFYHTSNNTRAITTRGNNNFQDHGAPSNSPVNEHSRFPPR